LKAATADTGRLHPLSIMAVGSDHDGRLAELEEQVQELQTKLAELDEQQVELPPSRAERPPAPTTPAPRPTVWDGVKSRIKDIYD